MAKWRYPNITKKLKKVVKIFEEEVPNRVEEIAESSKALAQGILASADALPDFTQTMGGEKLAEQITLKKNTEKGKSVFTITAGQYADDDTRWQLYFAEYGAGIDKINSFPPSNYVWRSDLYFREVDEEMVRITEGIQEGDYWKYPLGRTVLGKFSRGRQYYRTWDYANTSVPIEYMKKAKSFAREQLRKEKLNIMAKIKSTIKRV